MRVIVTRLLAQAARWAQSLAQHGHEGLALPLIEIAPVADPAELLACRRKLPEYDAAMFVSSPAVDGFLGLASPNDAPLPLPRRAWCTGPGTRAALLRRGMAPDAVDAPDQDAQQFDSEALWQRVGPQLRPGARVLIVRGDTLGAAPDQARPAGAVGVGRDWLAQRLQQAGAQVDFVVAYRRGVPNWSPAQLEQARAAAGDGSVWLFSSAEALVNLDKLLPAQDWSRARAVATHARIAAAARRLGFALVLESRPSLPEVLASLESIK